MRAALASQASSAPHALFYAAAHHPWGCGGFAQKVGFGPNFCIFNAMKISILLQFSNFWAKPAAAEAYVSWRA
jgi:hypothetical protein